MSDKEVPSEDNVNEAVKGLLKRRLIVRDVYTRGTIEGYQNTGTALKLAAEAFEDANQALFRAEIAIELLRAYSSELGAITKDVKPAELLDDLLGIKMYLENQKRIAHERLADLVKQLAPEAPEDQTVQLMAGLGDGQP